MFPKNQLRHRARLIVAGALLLPVLAACGSDGSSAKSSSNAPTDTSSSTHDMAGMSDHDMAAMNDGEHAVAIKLIAYKPGTLEVPVGTTVTWTQMDPGTHTVTSGTVDAGAAVTINPDGKFDSGELATGKSFSQTFDTAGTYSYFCRIHPATMQGEITVR